MNIRDYFMVESALERNWDLKRLCEHLRYDASVDQKLIGRIKRRTIALLDDLCKLKDHWDGQDQKAAEPELGT